MVTPLAADLGGGAVAVGVILAANALGETVGAIVFSRFVAAATRLRFMGPLAVGSCAVLLLFALRPGLFATLAILAASGLFACFQLVANAAFVTAAPQEQRSQAFGLAQGGMSLGQGAVMIAAGAAAQHVAPARVITVCGAVGTVLALAIAVAWARYRNGQASGGRHAGQGRRADPGTRADQDSNSDQDHGADQGPHSGHDREEDLGRQADVR